MNALGDEMTPRLYPCYTPYASPHVHKGDLRRMMCVMWWEPYVVSKRELPNKERCTGCKTYKPRSSFAEGSRMCKPCVEIRELNRKQPKGSAGFCVMCRSTLPPSAFSKGRRTCDSCRQKRVQKTLKGES